MILFLIKVSGGCLLACCGGGIGWLAAIRKKDSWQKIAAFERFLQYLLDAVRFRRLPGTMILEMASQHADFSEFCPIEPAVFSGIRPPHCLYQLIGTELREGLATMESASRQTVCDTLEHLCQLCRRAEMQVQESAGLAQKLYPRVGTCLGILIAIVLS